MTDSGIRIDPAVMGDLVPFETACILDRLGKAGYEARLVGGCVRDLLRHEEPHDWDICTSALPQQVREAFPDKAVIGTGERHGTVIVRFHGANYEVTTYRTDGEYSDGRRPDSVRFTGDLTEDLARRDFTMNAIAMDADGNVYDPFGGASDVTAGIVRCVGDPDARFREDGLRVIRALRFASAFGYSIEPVTAEAVHRNRHALDRIAAERIGPEMTKLLLGKEAAELLREYPDVPCVFWPEIGDMLAAPQNNPWHAYGVWEHTLHALEAAPPDPVIRLAVLLHDVGKPACRTTDGNGVDHFRGHDGKGAETAHRMLRHLRFDNDTVKAVTALVRWHDMQVAPTRASVRKWINRVGGPDRFGMLFAVRRADIAAQAPDRAPDRLAEIDLIESIAAEIREKNLCTSLAGLAVNGHDAIAAGIPEGPAIRHALRRILDEVLAGTLPNDRETLLTELARNADGQAREEPT